MKIEISHYRTVIVYVVDPTDDGHTNQFSPGNISLPEYLLANMKSVKESDDWNDTITVEYDNCDNGWEERTKQEIEVHAAVWFTLLLDNVKSMVDDAIDDMIYFPDDTESVDRVRELREILASYEKRIKESA